jgi:hypothetical protein
LFAARGGVVHSIARRIRPSTATAVTKALVVIVAAAIIVVATLLTVELMAVEAGLDGITL